MYLNIVIVDAGFKTNCGWEDAGFGMIGVLKNAEFGMMLGC